jgi:hypothetical protein
MNEELAELKGRMRLLHDDLKEVRQDIVRLEAKVSARPKLFAWFIGILAVLYAVTGVLIGAIVVLNVLGYIQ